MNRPFTTLKKQGESANNEVNSIRGFFFVCVDSYPKQKVFEKKSRSFFI